MPLSTTPRGLSPATRHALSVLWFPFFFVAAFAAMFLTSFTGPAPHGMAVGVAGDPGQVHAVAHTLEGVRPDGFSVRGVADAADGRALVARGDLAAVYVPGEHARLLVSSAASGTRADYLGAAVGGELSAHPVDVRPAAPGDVSGTGIFFYGLPLTLVGMIASIVLLQVAAWPVRRKAALIAGAGAFGSVVLYVLATAMDVLPGGHPLLLLYGFVLTQAVGWLTTAAAQLAKRYFMPLSMTFVLILGLPTAGGTVNADMLPGPGRFLNAFLPFAQFVDLTRAEAYFSGHGTVRPLLTLLAWAAAGAALLAWSVRRGRTRTPEAARPTPGRAAPSTIAS